MSSLDKLGIRGIRSFDNNELNVIQFFHPLTVIVGHNGSGKTTIIECLKYITTGDMPPNTKGGAFVHDPNMAGETEVKAEVKLRFINTNGDRMTANRRLQVTKKKTTLSLKTLEGTISYTDQENDRTKRQSLSTRCSDLDEEIPRLLGVSKAILENVIFCHQEESNWPLSEPSVLKKKFDDIFEATKYTKALDQIKSIRKEQAAELKVDKERLIALKTDRDRAIKVEGTIAKLERELTNKIAESEILNEQIQVVTAHNIKFYELVAGHDHILNEVKNLQIEKDLTESTMRDLRATMTEIPGSREELQQKRDNFAREAQQKQAQKQGYQRDLDAAEEEHNRLRRRVERLMTEKGVLGGEERRFEQALDDRQSIVSSLASQHDIKGFDVIPLEEEQIDDFERRLTNQLQNRKREYDEIRDAGKRDEDEKRTKISAAEAEQKSNQTVRRGLKEQQQRVDQRIDSLTVQIENARSSEGDVKNLTVTKQDAENRLKSITQELKGSNFDEVIKSKRDEVRRLEGQRDELHSELSGLNRQADTRAKLAIRRSELEKKEQAVNNLIESNSEPYRKHFGETPDRHKMLENVRDQISRTNGEMARAEKVAGSAQKELNQVESSMSLVKQQKANAEREVKDIEAKINEETEGRDLETAILEAESEIAERQKNIAQLQSAAVFYQRVLEQGKKQEVCIACARALSHDDLPAFEAYCKKQMAANPRMLKEQQEDLPQWQEILASLRKVEPLAVTAQKLRETDIPKHESELERANGRHQAATRKAEEATQRVGELRSALRELESLKGVANDVNRMMSETQDLKHDVENLERQLESSGSARTADDVQAELQQLGSTIEQAKKAVESAQRSKETLLERIRVTEGEISRATLNLKDAERRAEARASAEAQRDAAETERAQCSERLAQVDKAMRDSEPVLQRLRKDLRDFQEAFREKELAARETYDALVKGCDELQRSMDEVKRCRRLDTKSKIRKLDADIKAIAAQGKDQEEKMHEVRQAISKIEREEHDSKNMERNVDDNIRYKQLKETIAKLEEEIATRDIEGARKAKRQFDKDYEASRRKQTELQAEYAKVTGEKAMTESNLQERRAELESEYKDIRKLYTRQLIKVKTTDFAIQDLEKYGKALDNAIMKYHGHKMMEINDTAQALWNKCYQGTDIDTIMIKSDSDGVMKAGNRSYNYRVVMVKDQVEMDMRGRCSAGQKVLASIIIRLALAESFGTNCGILALDEPTTNLDKDNIEALANALADIIKERKAQSNFQLIVITHDEDFLTNLGASGAIEKYWRVSRNNKQKSTIERQRLDQH